MKYSRLNENLHRFIRIFSPATLRSCSTAYPSCLRPPRFVAGKNLATNLCNFSLSRLYLLLFLLILPSCGKQHLHRELTRAEKTLHRTEQRIIELQNAIALKEISQIRKEIRCFEQNLAMNLIPTGDPSFIEQRETLAHIIHKNPPCADEAREVLDEILALITSLSSRQ